MDDLIKLRDSLTECASAVDEVIKASEREAKGEKISKEEEESIQGKLVLRFLKMQQLADVLSK